MKFIIFIFALLFANLHLHSENTNVADADYCIDCKGEKKILDTIRLVLVKQNNNLKIRRNTQKPLECIGSYFYNFSTSFYFVDESGKELFSFESYRLYGGSAASLKIKSYEKRDDDEHELHIKPERVGVLPPEITIELPDTTDYMHFPETQYKKHNELKKKDFLLFKGNIIGAQTMYWVSCKPDVDTTYYINFWVRITGECERKTLNKQ
jgi:hypothetical protein